MEGVLEVYARSYNEKRPVVCMGETSFQLLDEQLEPFPMSQNNQAPAHPRAGAWLFLLSLNLSRLMHSAFSAAQSHTMAAAAKPLNRATCADLLMQLCEKPFLLIGLLCHGEHLVARRVELKWIDRSRIFSLPLWEGDKIFLRLLAGGEPFFSLKLTYRGDALISAKLNGAEMEL